MGAARVLASGAVAVELVSVAEETAPAVETVETTEAESLAPDPSVLECNYVVSAPSGDDTDLRECVT